MHDSPADPSSFALPRMRLDTDERDTEFWSWLLGVAILALGIAAAAWFLLTIPPHMLLDAATAEIVSHGLEEAAHSVPLLDSFVEH